MEAIAAASRWVRHANARVVLEHMWDGGAVTGTDLMAATGLSRATVHDVCDELIERGWIHERENQREHGGYSKGRPARRYAFDPLAGVVVGVDAGDHRISAMMTDLRGKVLARHTAPAADTVGGRLEMIAEAVRTVRRSHEAAASLAAEPALLAVVVGVPAPVDERGHTSFHGNPFWELMNPGIAEQLAKRHGWTAITDNDANLAALAEGWVGHGREVRNHVTLLAGERLGAGIVQEGKLLRGARGGAGEMGYLNLVEGVGSADGIAVLARDGARAGLRAPGALSVLQGLGPVALDAEAVFAAARAGDRIAGDVIERIGVRMARVVATLASFVDTEQVVIAGAVAASAAPVVDVITRDLPRYLEQPRPRVLASHLGGDVVALGAVKRALDHVREHALETALPAVS